MRSLFLFSIGLTTVACGLSMNPDLPSNREGDSGGVGATSGDGDIGLNPDLGSPSEGAGGASCTGLGGAGGGDSTAHESEDHENPAPASDPLIGCEDGP